ncbi:MAG: response regulator [Bacteroidetes bacterium]|jgi:two-component system LytT family response regulator|nr:response regulator [Bacteroidota bacterium]
MNALIVDDEQFCRDNLKFMLGEYCPDITATETAGSADEARKWIESTDVDVLFLDIKMPNETGFELLESLGEHNFSVVFTTAHNEYALEAIKAQAIDYLEKPINIEELQQAVKKVQNKSNDNSLASLKELLHETRKKESADEKIAIPMREGYEIIAYSEIVHLEASESYTTIHLNNGKRLLSSKNIKVYENKLDPKVFFRTHKSHIINLGYHIKGFNRIDGNSAVMSNGKYVPIARRKLQPFLDRISHMQ